MHIDTAAATAWLAGAAAAARAASRTLARSPAALRDDALRGAAAALREAAAEIVAANAADLARFDAQGGTAAFRDRLALSPERVEAMAASLESVADLPDPLARVLARWERPNGLRMERIATPIGVIGMVFESRPNVLADAAALCVKSGNAAILRGGSDSAASVAAIHAALVAGFSRAGLQDVCVVPPSSDRAYVAAMLAGAGQIDLIVPRGGKSLVARVQAEARVPVLAHAEGLCHTYVHAAADPAMARRILANAKMRRTGICGATETLLIDVALASSLLPVLVDDLAALGCAFRADARARATLPHLPAASDADFSTEWLGPTLSIAVVDGVEAALSHIARHGSEHTEAIVTEDAVAAEQFLSGLSSAVGLWNASTQFCDGGEFGFGAEIGIATGRIHARGPVGLEQLTCFRYVVRGTGQVRP
jgi:glutamate-5-semialdehyde dehydrogenase